MHIQKDFFLFNFVYFNQSKRILNWDISPSRLKKCLLGFLIWKLAENGFLDPKNLSLIFQPPLLWSKSKQSNNIVRGSYVAKRT